MQAFYGELKKYFSIISFLILVVWLLFMAKWFQAPKDILETAIIDQQKNREKFETATELIEVENRLGSFSLKKKFNPHFFSWEVTNPTILPVRNERVEELLNMVLNLKVKKVFPKDDINLINYSLKDPILKVILKNIDGEDYSLSLGMVNTIDNSAYVTLGNRPYIFQIGAFETKYENMEVKYFVDSKLFSFEKDFVEEIKLYRKSKARTNDSTLHLTHKDKDWFSSSGEALNQQKVNAFLDRLLVAKSHMILDKKTIDIESKVKGLFSSFSWVLWVKLKDVPEPLEYTFSSPINEALAKQIKLISESSNNIFVQVSHMEHPFVIDESVILDLLSKSISQLM